MNRTDAVSPSTVRQPKALLWSALFAGLASFYGCSAAKPPTETLAKAELDLRAAREAKADELAPMNLRSAVEELEKSKQAMADKRYEDARRLAESAQVDAELAEARAEARMMRRAADAKKGTYAAPTNAEIESRKPLTTNSIKD